MLTTSGLARPPHIVGTVNRVTGVSNSAWTALDIPVNEETGEKAKYAMLSWKITDPIADLWHLLALFSPDASWSPPAGIEDYALVLHGLAHNPVVVDCTGLAKLFVRASAGTGRYVLLGPVGNESAGNRDSLPSPLQIAADSASRSVSASGGNQISIPPNAAGEPPRYVLIAIDSGAIPAYFSFETIHPAYDPILHPQAHNPILLNARGHSNGQCRLVSAGSSTWRITPLEN